ncbi:transcriptional regulator [Anoxybacter fermentans]|uniref:Glucokinase n=1 Tax=Anoxybacter fermentans TaxID=1323375 RepID=A0A3Q9HNT1_9FIRM|nr:ROK family glucokinase [Anoxybacter fermentans]AZR72241.1 transcriptional regulator [Anoxybacter fermentans]
MNKKYVIGVDLGGTKILTAIADMEGKILNRVRVDTGADEPAENVIGRIIKTVNEVMEQVGATKDEVLRIGVGSPGPLDIEKGVVLFSPNLKWHNVPIVSMMEEELGLPVVLENDANAAALAEYTFGAGKGAEHMIYMTISTGIGGGVIINGQLLHGVGSAAGELGHHTIIPDGPQCGCGNYGCLEALASGTALGRYGREAVLSGEETLMREMVNSPEKVDGSVVTRAAEAGDKVALEIVDRVATYIGIGIANMINIFNPAKVVLGGGVIKAGHLFYDKILKTVEERALEAPRKQCEIVFAELGSDVGVLGAIAVALKDK